ncbi:hypothetical protein [Streptomyces paradoxus]|uniref:hypothetical protein n=1 Tax=Streptomyces paradoxus TaxID=66375 RepID=UPI00381484C9
MAVQYPVPAASPGGQLTLRDLHDRLMALTSPARMELCRRLLGEKRRTGDRGAVNRPGRASGPRRLDEGPPLTERAQLTRELHDVVSNYVGQSACCLPRAALPLRKRTPLVWNN